MASAKRLSPKFVQSYASKPVPWGEVGYVTYKRTYARLVPELGRTEEWHETCERVCNGLVEIGAVYSQDELERLFDHLFHLRGSVSGRALWQLGTDTVRRVGADSLQNCFAGETEILTSNGVRTLKDCAGTTVEVWTAEGWRRAEIKSFGVQPLMEVEFAGGEKVYATPDHQWVPVKGGSPALGLRIPTTAIDGERLPLNFSETLDLEPSREGFAHGFVFGDGNSRGEYTEVTLFNEKEAVAPFLINFGDLIQWNVKGVSRPHYNRLPKHWKSLPKMESRSYCLGFILGLIAADGDVRNSARIHNANLETLKEIRRIGQFAGLRIHEPYLDRSESPFDGSDSPVYCITISTFNLKPNYFWFPRRDQREALECSAHPKTVGVSVRPTDRVEEVYCAVVPGLHHFTLANGVLTGNCWHVACDKLEAFTFTFNQLMLGGGVGFNIMPEFVYALPPVKHNPVVERVDLADCDFVVPDNREGWVELLRRVLESFFITGKPLRYSTQLIRAAGKPIKGFGGTASGSESLVKGITQIVAIIRARVGQKMRPIDCLDVMNIIGQVVVAGNVRRSAQIAIGSPHDRAFLNAKNWAKASIPNWRAMSNNTCAEDVYDEIPDEFWSGYNGDGEPYGLCNLRVCREYGRLIDGRGYRPDPEVIGVNPCAEITLCDREPCNLSEIFLPNVHTLDVFKDVAVLLYKACKTISRYPFSDAETNAIVDRNHRIGIGVTGWMARQPWQDTTALDATYRAIEAADVDYSRQLGVKTSIKLTTVKPSGTLSLLPYGVTPGVHAAFARYMIRRIRFSANDPLVDVARRNGYHVEPKIELDGSYDSSTMVVEFPMRVPDHVPTEDQLTVVDQLEQQKTLQTYWADNSVSCTHYYKKGEVPTLRNWLGENYDENVKTCSFLLASGHGFQQAPLEKITEKQYLRMKERTTPITSLADTHEFETVDSMECAGGHCPIK